VQVRIGEEARICTTLPAIFTLQDLVIGFQHEEMYSHEGGKTLFPVPKGPEGVTPEQKIHLDECRKNKPTKPRLCRKE
jgi:hypothetical protein